MIKVSNSPFLRIFAKLLLLLVAAKGVSLLLLWLLPSDGVELAMQKNYKPKYQKVEFENMIRSPFGMQEKSTAQSVSNTTNITNMVLKGLYGKGKYGYIIVALKESADKTSIVAVGEEFLGFTLHSISPMSAIFTKAGREYTLELEKTPSSGTLFKRENGACSDGVAPKSILRDDIAIYIKNPQEIWKEISIVEVKNGEEIEGFRVTRVAKNSKIASLGLQKGDVIIKANNTRLKSYKDVMEVYSSLDKSEAVQIVVLRENQEVELVYEIH